MRVRPPRGTKEQMFGLSRVSKGNYRRIMVYHDGLISRDRETDLFSKDLELDGLGLVGHVLHREFTGTRIMDVFRK